MRYTLCYFLNNTLLKSAPLVIHHFKRYTLSYMCIYICIRVQIYMYGWKGEDLVIHFCCAWYTFVVPLSPPTHIQPRCNKGGRGVDRRRSSATLRLSARARHASLCVNTNPIFQICSVLQCVAVCCSVLQCVAVCCSVLQCASVHVCIFTHPSLCVNQILICINIPTCTQAHCNTVQHTATHCNTLQHTKTCVWIWLTQRLACILIFCATHCNTLQHTATHCNTLQHTATHKDLRVS